MGDRIGGDDEKVMNVVVGGKTIDDTEGLDVKAIEVDGVVNSTSVEEEG